MRKLVVCMLASVAVVGGCGLFKKADPDAGAVAATEVDSGPTTTTAPPVAAANAAAVARFASETQVSETRFIASVTQPRVSPKTGAPVATLKVGTEVTRVATNGADSLITFADPANPTVTLMGWVTDAAFTAQIVVKKVDAGVDSGTAVATVADAGTATVADAGTSAFSCSPGKSPVALGGKSVCRRSCTRNEDCKNRKPCISANMPANAATPNAGVRVCMEEP